MCGASRPRLRETFERYLQDKGKGRGGRAATIDGTSPANSTDSRSGPRAILGATGPASRPRTATGSRRPEPGDQQAWSPEQRHALTRHVDERVRTAVDRLGANDDTSLERQRARYGALRAARDRALVYVLAYSAVRVGECLRDPLGRGSRRRQRAGRSPGVPGCLSRPGPQRSIIVIATVFIQTANRDGRASPRGTRGVYRSGTASVQ